MSEVEMKTYTSEDGLTITAPNYKPVRQELLQVIGRDRFAELSKGNRWLDAWWAFWPPASVLLTAIAIGLIDNWWIRVPLIAFNGFNITNCAVVGHSLCTHRSAFGRRGSQVVGTFMHTISLLSFSIYTASHHYHHRTVNTPEDQDFEQVDLDKRWKRFAYMTMAGYVIASSRLFASKSSKHLSWNVRAYYRKQLMADPKRRYDVMFEAAYVTFFWAVIVAGCFWKPEFFLLGYVVPLLTTTTLANSLREATEHQGVDISNPWHMAGPSRPGIIRRIWMHQYGAVHFVHHLWPNLPHYRTVEVWDLIYPTLHEHGVVENRSFLEDVRRYYLRGEPRTVWTDDEGTTHPIPTLTAFGDADYAAARR